MNQKLVRITALVLAILIGGGVLAAAFTSTFALDATAPLAVTPDTGTDGPPVVPIVIGAVSVVLAIACALIPKIAKK